MSTGRSGSRRSAGSTRCCASEALFADLDFPFARPLPRRDRGAGARLGDHRICRRRAGGRQGQGGCRRRSRHFGHRLLPGGRTPSTSSKRRSATAAVHHPLQARLSQGRMGRHCRPGRCDRRDPAVHDRGGARQYRPAWRRDCRHAGAARPAGDGSGPQLLQQAGADLADADPSRRLRIQAGRAGRGADAGRRSLADRLARRRRREPAQSRGAFPRQHDRRHPFRAAVRLAGQRSRNVGRRSRGARLRPRRDQAAQRAPPAARRRALPSAAPAPPLQRGGRLLDGLGAQARQAARAQPSAARRQRHDVPAARKRRCRPTSCM